jgi:hypothetical protein
MESPIQPKYESLIPNQAVDSDMFSGKNLVILVLSFLLMLSFLGINLLGNLDGVIRYITELISPLLQVIGYTAGSALNKTSDLVADTAKTGVEIADGSVQNIGNLLIKASEADGGELDEVIDSPEPVRRMRIPEEPEPDTTANPIQKPISNSKGNWCLIGEVSDKRGCISVSDESKCMSGQVFPTQKMCLNPTMTPNREV